jgi:hypothetical protein
MGIEKKADLILVVNIAKEVLYLKEYIGATCKFKHHKQLIFPHSNF